MSSELLKKLCCCTPGCFQKVELCDCDEGPGEDLWTVCGSAEEIVIIYRNGKCYTYDPSSETYDSIPSGGTLIEIQPSAYENCEECCNPPGDYDVYEICSPLSSENCQDIFCVPHSPSNPDYITSGVCCYQKTETAADCPPGSQFRTNLFGFDPIDSCECVDCFGCPPTNCDECPSTYVVTIPSFTFWWCCGDDCEINVYYVFTGMDITVTKSPQECQWVGENTELYELVVDNQSVGFEPITIKATLYCLNGGWRVSFTEQSPFVCEVYGATATDCCPEVGTYEYVGQSTHLDCVVGCNSPPWVSVS